LLRGFAECLELDNAEIMKPVEDEFIGKFLYSSYLLSLWFLPGPDQT